MRRSGWRLPHVPSPKRGLALLLGSSLLLVVQSFTGPSLAEFRQDEVECEEAVAHLVECCPGFSLQSVSCTHVTSDGCDQERQPALDVNESRQVRSLSCGELQKSTWCAFHQLSATAGTTGT